MSFGATRDFVIQARKITWVILKCHFGNSLKGRFRRYAQLSFLLSFPDLYTVVTGMKKLCQMARDFVWARAAEDKAKETQKWVGMPNGPSCTHRLDGATTREFGKLHLHESEVHFFLQGMLDSTYGTFSRTLI